MSVQKRFVAGAVCPRCGEMDKLVVFSTDEGSFKECVACGYEEKQVAQVEIDELSTRVNHIPEDESTAEEVQVVTLLDPKNAAPKKVDPKKLH